jgi:hypothetical protein
MPSIISDNFRVFVAEQFIESLEEPYDSNNIPVDDGTEAAQRYRSKIYLFVGRSQNWDLEKYSGRTDVNEFGPPDPYDSFDEMNEIYDDMIAVKRVTRSDVSQVIRRRNWTSGTIYDMYKNDYTPEKLSVNGKSSLYNSNFYVMNDSYQVYKCIYNGQSPTYPNGRPSTVMPIGDSTTIIESPSDGYRWKYMYTINISEYIRFVSSDFIPVKTEERIKTAAIPKDGAIEHLLITNRGSNLASGIWYAPIIGDGTSPAIARIVIPTSGGNANKIDNVDLERIGAGYTYGKVKLTEVYSDVNAALNRTGTSTNLGTVVNVEAIISPPGGHGFDSVVELGAFRVMVNKSLDFLDGSGDIPVDSQFRRFGLISDPVSSLNTDLVSTTATACYAIKFPSTTNFEYRPGEIITQASTGAKGRVIHWDSVTKVLRYYQNEYLSALQSGANQYKSVPFSGTNAVTGEVSGTIATPDTTSAGTGNYFGITFTNGYATPEIKPKSGKIIYVENRKAVNRSNDQIEDIKLVIEF